MRDRESCANAARCFPNPGIGVEDAALEVVFSWKVHVQNNSDAVVTNLSIVALEADKWSSDGVTVLKPKTPTVSSLFTSQQSVENDPQWSKTYRLGFNKPQFVVLFEDASGLNWAKIVGGPLVSSQETADPHRLGDIAEAALNAAASMSTGLLPG